MKKHSLLFITLFVSITVALCFSTSAFAKIEWDFTDNIALEDDPLDIAISRDGETVYILCKKKLLLYSMREKKVTDTIPLTEKFSQIALTPDGGKVLLSSRKKEQVSIIQVTQVYDIEVGESPVIGKADAPVSVFAFLDYQ